MEWAEPDYLAFPAATTPNDPLFADQWGLATIQAPSAWDVTTGSATVPIAIVDSGIDFAHPDLSGKLWVNPGEIAGNGLDDDNNGYVDDVQGWDLVNADNLPADDNGHGTQVAGIAAASTNNSAGIAGVCWACKIMPVKVMQASGVANYSDIAAGVLYAAQKGARVINLSLGGYSYSSALNAAIQAASGTYGAVIVAGAGNDNLSTPFYPAAYPEVLAIAGTDPADAKAALSNYGAWVDVSAPAVGIKTTFMGGDYGDVDGTSYAAPFVAGVAGLLRSQNPDWSPDMVRAQVIHTADDIDPLNPGLEGQIGSGRVNADQAVRTPAQPLLSLQGYTVDGVVSGRPEPGSTVDLVVTLYNDWGDADAVQGTLSSSSSYVTMVTGSALFGDIPAYGAGANATPFRFSISASAPYAHDLALNLNVTAGGGYSAAIPLTLQTVSSVVKVEATIYTQTWTNDRIYLINRETGIPAGNTLTIEPGTEIRFDGFYSLNVAGELIADGTEEQPIRFTSNKAFPAPGDWGQIKFLDSSIDATYDGSGAYVSGSILRYAIVEYGNGIYLTFATPLIAHNAIRETMDMGVYVEGDGFVIEDNTIVGRSVGIMVGGSPSGYSIVRNNISHAEYGIQFFEGFGYVGMIAGNSVQDILHSGIIVGGPVIVTANRVVACGEGISIYGDTIVSNNLLVQNEGTGLSIHLGMPSVVSNTIVSNGYAGINIQAGTPEIHHNNLIAGDSGCALRNSTANDITATNNWWGTTDENAINEVIYDDLDTFGLGHVDFGSYLASPEQTAPAYVTDVHISPDTTLAVCRRSLASPGHSM